MLAQRLVRKSDGRGRTLALEVLIGTPAVAALIREKKTFQLQSVIQTGRKDGMQSMDEAIMELVRSGDISVDDGAPHLSSKDMLPALERAAPPGSHRSQAA